MSKKADEGDVTAYIDVLASSAAAILRALKSSEGEERRKIVAAISKAAMLADVDADAAGALAHLLNTHGK